MQLYGSCFYPNTLIHYTYFAMNAYYHASGSLKFDCNFNSSRFIALTDPGSSSCSYPENLVCTASDEILQSNIDFACRQTNCDPIKQGSLCFNPNTLMHHASYAMNNYYQLSGKVAGSCDFQNSAMIVTSKAAIQAMILFAILLPPKRTSCVAKPAATDRVLQGDTDYSCSHADCGPVQQGGVTHVPTMM
ncbi:glucan endo-1,3-beta-glucosidase 2-like isoform X2 [Mangifera indica]|uniref:glucan endo-1,3-beta-glucosidase 2-like isoform X2 n=1 Tax=Mangifera indica TaxID=29780 RepID=UPI001CFB35AE|nr:glucan endo-1,3-beta-glucosidase 2-like isoform X2 [Mangifera indica]